MKRCFECQTSLVYDEVMGKVPSEYLRCPGCGNRYKVVSALWQLTAVKAT